MKRNAQRDVNTEVTDRRQDRWICGHHAGGTGESFVALETLATEAVDTFVNWMQVKKLSISVDKLQGGAEDCYHSGT